MFFAGTEALLFSAGRQVANRFPKKKEKDALLVRRKVPALWKTVSLHRGRRTLHLSSQFCSTYHSYESLRPPLFDRRDD